jgi:hypothetical protein
MTQHISDDVRAQLQQMKHPGAKIQLDVALERRPSMKRGNASSELIPRKQAPSWFLPRGKWAPTGPASITRTLRDK